MPTKKRTPRRAKSDAALPSPMADSETAATPANADDSGVAGDDARVANPALAALIASPDDLTGDYFLWLDGDCPVHSAAVAGIDIPKHVDLFDFLCPSCAARFAPPLGAMPACPKCGARTNHLSRQSLPRRAKKRIALSDAQLREVLAKLDPHRPIRFDSRGRLLDGPKRVPGRGGAVLLWPFVRILLVAQATDEPESAEEAASRLAAIRRLATIAERLATADDIAVREKKKLRDEIAAINRRLGHAPTAADADEIEPGDDGANS